MPRPPVSEIDQILAAYYYAEQRMSQADIAVELRLSPAVISRIIERVRGVYFEKSLRFLGDNLPAAGRAALANRLLAKDVTVALDRISRFAVGRPGV